MDRSVVIVGGGLAGLAAGCYARASGYQTTIVEHNLALGGVCTAWPRGPYLVDGCIQWLTGGPFAKLYEELGIVPKVRLQTLERWATWRDARDGTMIEVSRDLGRFAASLKALSPPDAAEIDRLMAAAEHFTRVRPNVDQPPEIASLRDQLHAFWEMRGALGDLSHFRKPISVWAEDRLRGPVLRRFFQGVLPEQAPAVLLLMVFGYLQRGWLSRPAGGSAAFRDALVGTYQRLGGKAMVHATVDEVLVEGGKAAGVRLDDGTLLPGDAVICTSSTPETILRLLGGRYDADVTRERMAQWRTFQPIVLVSFGVDRPLSEVPPLLVVDGLGPFSVGGTTNQRLSLRVCNDDPALMPRGHAVVQATMGTDYGWWATRGTGYEAAKEEAARVALAQIEHVIPDLGPHVRMTDVATPLTYWRQTRSWRGAYEGWEPSAESLFGHVKKRLAGLRSFYLAGQWVEPGGGVPTAVMSGRQAAQILCDDDETPFWARPAEAHALPG